MRYFVGKKTFIKDGLNTYLEKHMKNFYLRKLYGEKIKMDLKLIL